MPSILPKNKLENVNFCPSLLGQKFFIPFFGKLKTKQKVLLKLTHLYFLLEVTPVLNLERCPNQLSNFGELSKSALQIWLPSDFWQTTDRLMTDSQHKPDWLPTDSYSLQIQLLFVGLDTSWRGIQISSPILESFPNQLSKFVCHQTPDRLLMDSRRLPIDSWWIP